MKTGLAQILISITLNLLGWTVVNNFVVEISLSKYIVVELIVSLLFEFYKWFAKKYVRTEHE
jgi:hypothetical protein